MSAWPIGTIGDLCQQDRRTVAPDNAAATRLRFVGVEHVEADTGEISEGNGSRTGDGKSVSFAFTSEHVLYSKLRPYLNKVAAPDFDGKCSTELIPLRPRAGIDRRFLAYALRRKAIADAVTTASTGARMPRADLLILMRQPVPLPPIEEQRCIATALDRAARLVRLHKQAAAKTRDLIPALFIDMFGDLATNPKGWDVVEFGSVISTGPQNGLYRPASDYGADGVPILRIDSFDSGWLTKAGDLRRVRLDADTISKFQLHEGDVVINRVNSLPLLGKSVLIPALDEPTVFESNMMRLAVRQNLCSPRWIATWLQLDDTRRVLRSKAKQAINQASVNQGDIASLQLYLPDPDRQRRFTEIAEILVQRTLTFQSAISSATSLQDSMLSEIFGAA